MNVLIYMPKNILKPTGGPRGYLYNLEMGLRELDLNKENIKISYLPDHNKERMKKIFNKIPKRIRQKYYDYTMYKRVRDLLIEDGNHCVSFDLSSYDIIHFHSSDRLLSIRDSLKDYTGIVVFTNHSPKPQHREWIEDVISEKEYKRHRKVYDQLSELEAKAYELADYIVFPCEEAEEPCVNNWILYPEIRMRNQSKYRYLLTGTKQPKTIMNRKQLCQKLAIPSDSFIICYVGRHNITKGYDTLLEIGNRILDRFSNVYFVIAGKEGPLFGLKHNQWIETGWIDDPGSYYEAADIFLLPNKETYFDLVMLEALASGTVILASRTGGNKYFERSELAGILLYDTVDEAIEKLENLINMEKNKRIIMAESNRKIFENLYNTRVFAKSYISLLKSIYDGI